MANQSMDGEYMVLLLAVYVRTYIDGQYRRISEKSCTPFQVASLRRRTTYVPRIIIEVASCQVSARTTTADSQI